MYVFLNNHFIFPEDREVFFFGEFEKITYCKGEITEFWSKSIKKNELMVNVCFYLQEVNYFRNRYFVFMNYFSECMARISI